MSFECGSATSADREFRMDGTALPQRHMHANPEWVRGTTDTDCVGA